MSVRKTRSPKTTRSNFGMAPCRGLRSAGSLQNGTTEPVLSSKHCGCKHHHLGQRRTVSYSGMRVCAAHLLFRKTTSSASQPHSQLRERYCTSATSRWRRSRSLPRLLSLALAAHVLPAYSLFVKLTGPHPPTFEGKPYSLHDAWNCTAHLPECHE
jgi:hypothetical protein